MLTVNVNFSVELTEHQTKQAKRVVVTAAYLKHEESDSKRKLQDATRRYIKDWGYVTFLNACNQYPNP